MLNVSLLIPKEKKRNSEIFCYLLVTFKKVVSQFDVVLQDSNCNSSCLMTKICCIEQFTACFDSKEYTDFI